MNCCDQPGLLPLNTGLARLLERISPCLDTETVALNQARGHVLAEDVSARYPVPGFDNSAMDGYAVRFEGFSARVPLPLQGKAMAGMPFDSALKPGHCVRIMTGAPVPRGTDAVIMQEEAQETAEGIVFERQPKAGNNIRRTGEDLMAGATVLAKGHRVGPVDLALLSSVGAPSVLVYRKTQVALFSTGDELREPSQTCNHGDIHDANRPVIRALLESLNVEVLDLGILPDNPGILREAILRADSQCDFVITSGGVSVGDADYVRDIIEEKGAIEFWKLAIKPGKPFAFGKLPNSWFIGLPGNPVSATVTFHLLGVPAIRQFQGSGYRPMQTLKAHLQCDLDKKPGRMEFLRGSYSFDEDTLWVKPTRSNQGSHILSTFSQSNCYIVLDAQSSGVAAGENVTIWLFDGLLQP